MNIKIVILLALVCAVAAVPQGKSLKEQVHRDDEDSSSSISDSDSDSSSSSEKTTTRKLKTTTPKPTVKSKMVKSGNPAAAPAAPPAPAYVAPKIIKKF